MTNDERNPKPESRKTLGGGLASIDIRISAILRLSSFVIRICEAWFTERDGAASACCWAGRRGRNLTLPLTEKSGGGAPVSDRAFFVQARAKAPCRPPSRRSGALARREGGRPALRMRPARLDNLERCETSRLDC